MREVLHCPSCRTARPWWCTTGTSATSRVRWPSRFDPQRVVDVFEVRRVEPAIEATAIDVFLRRTTQHAADA